MPPGPATSRKVICGTDATWRSSLVMAVADELAERARLPLEALHVMHAESEHSLRMRGNRVQVLLRESTGRTDVPVVIECGGAAERLIAATADASMLVLGARRRRLLHRVGLAATVARHAACPVIVVPVRTAIPCAGTRLVCAVRDGRDLATAADAACWARDLDLELLLVSVVGPPRLPVVAGLGVVPALPPTTVPDRIAAARRDVAELAEAIHRIAPSDVLVEATAASAAHALPRIARRCDAALVALGPSAPGILGGATMRALVRHGERPVLVSPRSADAISAWTASAVAGDKFAGDVAP